MPREKNYIKEARKIIQESGILRPRDLETHGIPRQYLYILEKQGMVHRIGRGLYLSPEKDVSEFHSYAEACKRVPQGVICLLSALRFYNLTTQTSSEVWMAIGPKTWQTRAKGVRMRIVRFSGDALMSGIEEHIIEGVNVRVYCEAKTVADCFKFRNKIGKDVALEAIRDFWKRKRGTMDDLWKYAKICRVSQIMLPYMESMV